MSDEQRVYTDEEFALILRKAAELASRDEVPGSSSTGLTPCSGKVATVLVHSSGFVSVLPTASITTPIRSRALFVDDAQ